MDFRFITGFRGRVRERLSDGSVGPGIQGVHIIISGITYDPINLLTPRVQFKKVRETVTTNTTGSFRIKLKKGVYSIYATHSDFETYWSSKMHTILDVGLRNLVFFMKKKSYSTVFVLRHAEYDVISGVPNQGLHLNSLGVARAEQLGKVLCDADVNEIFVSDFVRTQETAQELATNMSLAPIIYSNSNIQNIVQQIKTNYIGKTIVIVGHSNTVPQIINEFILGSPVINIDYEFHNLFVITLCGSYGENLLNLWYGNTPNCIQ